ncbi:MAG: NAD(P)H-dependent oxidoreductase [Candidatus Bathyarchaeia archaeon]
MTMKIPGISGSGRNGSYHRALLEEAARMLPENATLKIADVTGFPLFRRQTAAGGPGVQRGN